METKKPLIPSRGRAALLVTACLVAPLMAGEPLGGSGLAENEVSRRKVAIQEAQELLLKGDEAYNAGRYGDAVEAYSGARILIPDAPVSAELRSAATQRYAQASVEHARVLSRKGDVAKAKEVVDKVLDPAVAPNDPGAKNFRAQLDDPIRTNPALTAEHAQNVDEVRRKLYTAEGAYNLGKFDQAATEYQEVLRIDPTNTAARRGMEVAANAKRGYQKSAGDQARAEMLSQVDAEWELKPTPIGDDPALAALDNRTMTRADFTVRDKIEQIIIPRVSLDQSSLEEALDFLRARAVENDTLESDPAKKGVNFTVNLGAPGSPEATEIQAARFDLQLANVPLSQVLKYLTDITKTKFTTDDFSVVISPINSGSTELISKSYRVPPDFVSSMSVEEASGAAAEDPFSSAPSGGLLAKKLTVQEALAKQGVAFPEGASANYSSTSGILRVINTPTNHDFISQLVDTVARTEPVIVSVKVTMMKIEENRLEELGFDWILDNYGFGGPSWVEGNNKLNLTGGTVGTGDSLGDFILPNDDTINRPITAGNRSGDSAISGNSIDNLLTNGSGRQAAARAPGVFGWRGNLSNGAVQGLMRGLDQKKGVDMLSQPSVSTRSGQSSSIVISREFMYATEYEPPELPNTVENGSGGSFPVTPATPTAFTKRDVGTTLEVLPVVDEQKQYIDITLTPTFSEFDGFVNYGSPINAPQQDLFGGSAAVQVTENAILMPIFSKQTLSTNVTVADGATVVLGGLKREAVQNVEDKTPILGDIPIIGRLFQSKARQATSTAIIFLVNVELLDPTGRPYRNR